MTALSPDTDPAETASDETDAPRSRLNPLAIAVFTLAVIIGGLLVWLSFAGGPQPGQFVVPLNTEGGAERTILSGDTVTAPPPPQVLDGTDTPPADTAPPPDEPGVTAAQDAAEPADTADTSAEPGGLQEIGSLDPLPLGAPLREAPIAGLFEETDSGLLPIISGDGARAVASYARPFTKPAAGVEARPRVAILITGFGLNRTFAERALEQLPADISLGFTPYSGDLQNQINAARADGHEVVLELPMEPFNYPDNDPGPYTLLTSLPEDANRKRLEWLLARGTGYFATVNRQGGRFLSETDALSPILTALKLRGLGFIDTGSTVRSATVESVPEAGFDWARGSQVIDATKSPRQIDQALKELEDSARQSGIALGIGTALPVTVERVAMWAEKLDAKGIDLVPVSAVLADR